MRRQDLIPGMIVLATSARGWNDQHSHDAGRGVKVMIVSTEHWSHPRTWLRSSESIAVDGRTFRVPSGMVRTKSGTGVLAATFDADGQPRNVAEFWSLSHLKGPWEQARAVADRARVARDQLQAARRAEQTQHRKSVEALADRLTALLGGPKRNLSGGGATRVIVDQADLIALLNLAEKNTRG